MKIRLNRSSSGFITLFLILIIVLMSAYAISNARALGRLDRELRLVEKRQIRAHRNRKESKEDSSKQKSEDGNTVLPARAVP